MRAAVWNGPGAMSVGVTPDPICPEPVPQFAGLLKNAGVCGFVVQLPVALPVGVT